MSRPSDAKKANGAAPDWRKVVVSLAKLDAVEYDRQREDKAKDLGIRTSTLDTEVKKLRADDGDVAGQGRALQLHEIEPAAEPVAGAAMLEEVRAAIRRHVALDDHAATAAALWCVMSHLMDNLDVAPRLIISSPEKGCGKSTLLDLVGCLVPRPLPCSNIKAAAIFRTIEAARPTLMIDEADSFIRDDEELRGVLNSGHSRSSAFVVRCVGEDHEPRMFSTWAAMALAGIGRLPSTLMDRGVVVELRRKMAGDLVDSLDRDARSRLTGLARRVARWARDHALEVADHRPAMPAGIVNRAADNWSPLLAIADLAGGDWPALARQAADGIQGAADDDSLRVRLLRDIRTIFEERDPVPKLLSSVLANSLAQIEDSPWPEFSNGKALTPAKLARLLKAFKVKPKQSAAGSFYERERFIEAWARYLPPAKCHSATNPANPGDSSDSKVPSPRQARGTSKTEESRADAGSVAQWHFREGEVRESKWWKRL